MFQVTNYHSKAALVKAVLAGRKSKFSQFHSQLYEVITIPMYLIQMKDSLNE